MTSDRPELSASKLPLAEKCRLSAKLSHENPTASPAADLGTEVHEEIADHLWGGFPPRTPRGIAASNWYASEITSLRASGHEDIKTQVEQSLDFEGVTGSCDLAIVLPRAKHCVIVDWKTGSRSSVEPASTNLQLQTYGLATANEHKCDSFQCILVFLREDGSMHIDRSRIFNRSSDFDVIAARIRKIQAAQPIASPGDHCVTCYSRLACPQWRHMAALAVLPLALPRDAAIAKPGPLDAITVSDKDAGDIMQLVKRAREWADSAEDVIKSHVEAGGQCVVNGKRYVKGESSGRARWDTEALERDGLAERYRTEGKPFARWEWRK